MSGGAGSTLAVASAIDGAIGVGGAAGGGVSAADFCCGDVVAEATDGGGAISAFCEGEASAFGAGAASIFGAGETSVAIFGGAGGDEDGALAMAVPGRGSIATGGGGAFAVDGASSVGFAAGGEGVGVIGLTELAVYSGAGISARRSLLSTSAYAPAASATAQTAMMAAGLSITTAI